MSSLGPTATSILEAARLLFCPGDVVEVRVPKAGKQRTISGYYTDLEKLARDVATLEREKHPGVYWTLNPVHRDLLSRATNRVKSFVADTTKDEHILCRRWLPIDLDPKRPVGISSTDAEHAAALQLAETVRAALAVEGWPEPVYADSGNGAHLLYRVSLLGDAEATDLLSRCLKAVAARFGTVAVDVDVTTFNASRIFKAYGTTARKGDSTEERPHRLARILYAPESLEVVPLNLLSALAMSAPVETSRPSTRPASGRYNGPQQFNVENFLLHHGVRFRPPVPHEGGRKFVLEDCPFDPAHKAPDSAVFELADGSFGFKCFHNSCNGRQWRDVRELLEPRRQRVVPPEPASSPESSPETHDPPGISPEDVEAAIDEAIAKDDLIAAIRLAPQVGPLRPVARAVIKAKLKLHFGRDFPSREFDNALDDASDETGQKNSNAAPPGGGGNGDDGTASIPEGPDLRPFPLTDGGNGERIAALYGNDIRYCVEMKKWLVWDGRRWAVDEFNLMRRKGKEMARLLYLQAAREQQESLAKAFEKHARESESYSAISNALGQAASEKGIPISATELDLQPMLLNCLNGVVDLNTGTLLPHKREFLLTKLVEVKYDPAAKCPQFLAFLHWAMGYVEDHEVSERTARLVAFLQRALGYSLTGNVSTRVVFVCYGEGKNGKSTLLNLFRALLGIDYSSQLLIDTVMSMKKQDATARADLADLRGSRFVVTTEVEKEHRLNEGTIKSITAGIGSTIKSCRKYENPIEFPAPSPTRRCAGAVPGR